MGNNVVYKTTNNINNKIYIGIHETEDTEDGYLGSGDLLKAAIRKYGKENFSREILYSNLTREEASNIENKLVDEDFIKREDTYNLALGGKNKFISNNTNPMKNPEVSRRASITFKSNMMEKYGVSHHMKTEYHKEKTKKTVISRYGVDNVMKSKEVQNTQKSILKTRYGVDSYFKTQEFKEKTKKTMLKKYGVENIFDIPGRRELALMKRKENQELKKTLGLKTSSELIRETLLNKSNSKYPILLEQVELISPKGDIIKEGILNDFRYYFTRRKTGLSPSELIKLINNKGGWKTGKRKGQIFRLKEKL